jgi:hypothetical protein
MKNAEDKSPIPYDVALKLCKEIRDEAEVRWTTASARWCYSCREARGDSVDQRGFMLKPGNRGCVLVNARYALMHSATNN